MSRNRVLMLASVASMIKQFNMSNIKLLQSMECDVDVACNFIEGNTCTKEEIDKLKEELKILDVKCFQIDFSRSVSDIAQNLRAYKQVLSLIKDNKYKFVHCHSPIGGVAARIAGAMTNTKVIYTAHGFHFYKGTPLLNWLLYYPIEWVLSWCTDVLITINREDYERAKNHFHAKKTEHIPGVGIDTTAFAFSKDDVDELRKKLGCKPEEFFLLSVGELNDNKNQSLVINTLATEKNYWFIII